MADQTSQDLAECRAELAELEPAMERWRIMRESLSANDPEAQLIDAWFCAWKTFRLAVNRASDISGLYELYVPVRDLNDWMPGISITRPPFPAELVTARRDSMRAMGFSEGRIDRELAAASKPERGAPRTGKNGERPARETAIEALRLKQAKKSWPRVADALCPEHGKSKKHGRFGEYGDKKLDRCSAKYRDQARKLQAVLKKYYTPPTC
jgi:hypothetical protein